MLQLKTEQCLSSVSKCYNPSTNFSSVSPVVSPTIPMSLLNPPRFGVLSCGSMALCSGVPMWPCSMDPDMGPPKLGWGELEWSAPCWGDGWGCIRGEGLEWGACCEGGRGDCTGAGERTWLPRVFAIVWPGRWAPAWAWPWSMWGCGLIELACAEEPICCFIIWCCCCWSMRCWKFCCPSIPIPGWPIWDVGGSGPIGPPPPCIAMCCCCCCIRI